MEVSSHLHAPASLLPGGGLCTRWTGGWMSLRSGLDAAANRQIPAPTGNRAHSLRYLSSLPFSQSTEIQLCKSV